MEWITDGFRILQQCVENSYQKCLHKGQLVKAINTVFGKPWLRIPQTKTCVLRFNFTMRTNLPKTLDLLIFSIYSLNFSLECLELLKFSHSLPNISKFLPPQRPQWTRMGFLCWFFVGSEILLTHMILLYHWTS